MAAPTAPYCESSDVAALLPNLIKQATDFTEATIPTKTAVNNLIGQYGG